MPYSTAVVSEQLYCKYTDSILWILWVYDWWTTEFMMTWSDEYLHEVMLSYMFLNDIGKHSVRSVITGN